jgi:uracil-DNA glycosylase
MSTIGTFPFGQPIKKVEQEDRTPKKVFVLGVYASAVHAKWIGPGGKQLISAVGVASEPEIFWRGDWAEKIIAAIDIPNGVGRFVPASKTLNGPSGVSLDKFFLEPLRIGREDVWLCDLLPYSCMNDEQAKALKREYLPRAKQFGLPEYNWGPVPDILADEDRRNQIKCEIAEAQPDVLITLGDDPLKWFAKYYGAMDHLEGYGSEKEEYGRLHPLIIDGRQINLLPLAHPRQAGRLGLHSPKWAALHDTWREQHAPSLI